MRNSTIVAGALACTVLGSGTGQACATVTFSVGTATYTSWNPISGTQESIGLKATVHRSIKSGQTGAPRSFRFILLDSTSEDPPKIGSSGPTYQVTTGGRNILFKTGTDITTLTTPQVSTSNLNSNASGDSVDVNLSYVVPGNNGTDYVGGTTYAENLNFAVQCYTATNGGGTSTTGGGAANSVSLTIPKLVSLVTASPQTIDFGNFTTATQQLNIGLKSTSSVDVSVATSNDNQMLLQGAEAPYPTNSVIAYTMTLNGDTVANGTSLTNRPRAGVAGTNWPLVLSLTGGVPSGKVAGGYSDTITLTLTPGS